MKVDDRIDFSNPCPHVTQDMKHKHLHRPAAPGCKECLAMGSSWVHLRVCLECGHIGCCDSSPNRHATAHYRATRHPVITSGEAGETWAYCYSDDQFLSAE
jgi:uncharacterized UBP type Zn finger protein